MIAPAPRLDASRRVPSHETITITLLVAAFTIAYSLVSLFRHWHFGSGYDLGIFDQAIWHLSRFEAPASTVSGYDNILGDHFYPMLVVLAPLYWVVPAVETLLVSQAVLLSLSVIPVYLFARERLPYRDATILAISYGSFWGIQRAAWFDFHEMAFAPLLVGVAVLGLSRRRWGVVWAACALLCLVKEDLIPFATGVGVYLMGIGERRQGAALLILSLTVFTAVVLVVVPSLNDSGTWVYGGEYLALLAEPWRVPLLLVVPLEKVRTILLWLVPFLFIPVSSPISLLAIPIAFERLLSANPYHWAANYHYSAPLAPILAMATADALVRLRTRFGITRLTPQMTTALLTASLVLSSVLPGHQPLVRLFSPKHYRTAATTVVGHRALGSIPPDASVVAQTPLVPHLTHRQRIYVLGPAAPDADYVVAASRLPPWPNGSADDIRRLLADRQARGYSTVFDEDGWIVLRRPQ